MKQVVLKTFKVFLIALIVLTTVTAVSGTVWVLGWPWWVGVFLLMGLLGLYLGFLFFQKIWIRHREKRFVSTVIDQDEAYLKNLGDKEKEHQREIQRRWKEAIGALRASHLRKQGNPLYVLPWYLMIGESGSGKTTALGSARLSSPFAEVSRTSGVSGTRNCDWWFFEQAIIIDTAGRWSIPVDPGRDKEEWERFLGYLVKFRKREPINGVVVTIAADKLLGSESQILEEDGRNIRRRLDELMRVLGARFPVYILVTKCDLIQGMNQFSQCLPEAVHDQPMGHLNQDPAKGVAAFHSEAMECIAERLKELRLLLLHPSGHKADPELLLFPEEFERLKPGLGVFMNTAFQDNPYQETPVLRGLYFSSGRKEGTPYSHFLKALGLIGDQEVLPGADKGLFLHDFFSKILPKDRGLFSPTGTRAEWGQLTRNLGIASWAVLVFALCGLLAFSFANGLKILSNTSQAIPRPPLFQGEILTDVIHMDRFRKAIITLEEKNSGLWPRFGLNQPKYTEALLKNRYCEHFQSRFLIPFDKQIADSMAAFSDSTRLDVIVTHVDHLVNRIRLLRARLEGEGLASLVSKPQPSYEPISMAADQNLIPEIREKYALQYLHFLAWHQDKTLISQQMSDLQTWLKHILITNRSNLNWLVDWVNANPDGKPLTLSEFWGGSSVGLKDVRVQPAFTLHGKDLIDSFLKDIESVLPDPIILAGQKREFQSWYRKAYINDWNALCAAVPQGLQRLKGKKEWQQTAERMAADESPYFLFLDRSAKELDPFIPGEDLPAWISGAYDLRVARLQGSKLGISKDEGKLAEATKKGIALITGLGKKMGKADEEISLESMLIAAKTFQKYQEVLSKIIASSHSRESAYELAVTAFTEDPKKGQSALNEARTILLTLKNTLGRSKGGADEKIFLNLVGGPLDFLWTFVCRETACHLQGLWEKEVLRDIQGVSNREMLIGMLFGQEGLARKFAKGSSAPFVDWSLVKGFYPKEILGQRIPFHDDYLPFMTKGFEAMAPRAEPISRPQPSSYIVKIEGLPTDVNAGARQRPQATKLEIQCGNETLKLENYNYFVQMSFEWSPEKCGDVVFKIVFDDLVLTKDYSGKNAFPKFLKDFKDGKRTFYPGDFPREESVLRHLGIESIRVAYEFRGHRPVLETLEPPPPDTVARGPKKVPQRIAICLE